MHSSDPSRANVNPLHALHNADPSVVEIVPGAQFVQTAFVLIFAYVPALQILHTPDAVSNPYPSSQSIQNPVVTVQADLHSL